MKTVDLFNVVNYGAQYLHSRCGLISPFHWLHLFRYLHKCNFGDGLLAILCPYRTLTDKKLQALLGTLSKSSAICKLNIYLRVFGTPNTRKAQLITTYGTTSFYFQLTRYSTCTTLW